ncbi:hypothetical protein BCR34DRAFT_565738 [Clohesyomyces aquaticus]|uniref:Uncharacterized protein n=1 Tax=Clohesyomyces aquaticus TaxID=1231657 RepID=A0A1Y1ZMU2_9PLEO|nr:hypothetical protein BCR34DRAFT_565738 [Clohesyomyces aquaticus]
MSIWNSSTSHIPGRKIQLRSSSRLLSWRVDGPSGTKRRVLCNWIMFWLGIVFSTLLSMFAIMNSALVVLFHPWLKVHSIFLLPTPCSCSISLFLLPSPRPQILAREKSSAGRPTSLHSSLLGTSDQEHRYLHSVNVHRIVVAKPNSSKWELGSAAAVSRLTSHITK